MLRQQRDVVSAFPERRKMDSDDIQTIVEILAEITLRDSFGQILIGRGDHADIDGEPILSAHPANLMLLENPQESGLHVLTDTADLV